MTISVRELIEFVYQTGDLNFSFSSGNRMLQGAETHRTIQKQRKDNWQNEVYVKYTEQQIIIHGRIDGIHITDDITIVEEIKTYVSKQNFQQFLLSDYIDHDYWLKHSDIFNDYQNSFIGISFLHWAQALIYSFIYLKNNGLNEVMCRVNYVFYSPLPPSKRGGKSSPGKEGGSGELHEAIVSENFLTIFFNYTFEKWLSHNREFNDLKQSVQDSLIELEFPFKFRFEQRKLAVAVYSNIKNGNNLYSRAPTGTGKTLATIFPALKCMGEEKTEKIFYLTAKTVGRTVAESAVQLLQLKGANIRYCVLTAKEKACLKEYPLCEPDHCEYAFDYFKKQKQAFAEALTVKIWNYDYIYELSKTYELCPFEFSLYLSQYAEIVICDYNYAFDPIIYIRRHFDNLNHSYTFLIDESHNLPDRAREMYSREISTDILNEWLDNFPLKRLKIYKKLIDLKLIIINLSPVDKSFFVLKDYPTAVILLVESIIELIIKQLEKKNKPYHKYYLIKIYFQLLFLINAVKSITNEHVVYYKREQIENSERINAFPTGDERGGSNNSLLKIYCLNPKLIFNEYLKFAKSAVFFSATLHPFNYFCDILSEKERDQRLALNSPFDSKKFGLYLYTGINTLYKFRENAFKPIAELIINACNVKNGNYLVYFPSFSFLNNVLEQIQICENNTFYTTIHAQKRTMTEKQREEFLDLFNDTSVGKIGFAVLGGIFGEGIDLLGAKLIGCIIVTVGLPSLGPEKDLIKNYYNSLEKTNNSKDNGFDYAYRFPGFNKVQQAAGRVIRSEEDKGFVVLIDQRYINNEYKMLYPNDWGHFKVFNKQFLLEKEIERFWND